MGDSTKKRSDCLTGDSDVDGLSTREPVSQPKLVSAEKGDEGSWGTHLHSSFLKRGRSCVIRSWLCGVEHVISFPRSKKRPLWTKVVLNWFGLSGRCDSRDRWPFRLVPGQKKIYADFRHLQHFYRKVIILSMGMYIGAHIIRELIHLSFGQIWKGHYGLTEQGVSYRDFLKLVQVKQIWSCLAVIYYFTFFDKFHFLSGTVLVPVFYVGAVL